MANKSVRKEEENTKPGFAASVNDANLPNFNEWSDDQIGYAPYWHPDQHDISKFFFGTLVARDERNPKFIRFLFVSGMDGLICQRGPNAARAEAMGKDVEYVTINKGDQFSLSVYKGPEDIFNEYLEFQEETGIPLLIRVQAKEKVVQNNPEKPFFWTWHPVKMHPEQKKKLLEWRATRQAKNKALVSGESKRPALES